MPQHDKIEFCYGPHPETGVTVALAQARDTRCPDGLVITTPALNWCDAPRREAAEICAKRDELNAEMAAKEAEYARRDALYSEWRAQQSRSANRLRVNRPTVCVSEESGNG